jgi:predicted dehydrogenase
MKGILYPRISFLGFLSLFLAIVTIPCKAEGERIVRLGIIGLDTSHVTAFTHYINDPANDTGCKVIAAYPGGSPDIPSSADRLDQYTLQLKEEFGVEMVESVERLCEKVDGILLESVDGRPHLEQIKPVIEAGKPVFVDKPLAGSLEDVLEIYRLADLHGVPCWSSSSLRYSPGIQGMRSHEQ